MTTDPKSIRQAVREHYAKQARSADTCCGDSDSCDSQEGLYPQELLTGLPDGVTNFSLGCGDPITLADLQPGETVLDLGSGGGLDCFLAAKKVGESGCVIGVDMTPEMLERARANAERLGYANVEFRQGYLEDLPVENDSIDVVISNCVINLSPDKPQVFLQIFRVLKLGGRVAVSDIVTNGPLPKALRENIKAWGECLGGAQDMKDYLSSLGEAGFRDIKIQPRNGSGEILSKLPLHTPFSATITARR
jgi:arsenite methyltransferase